MSDLSVNDFVALTGRSRAQIDELFAGLEPVGTDADGRSKLYDSATALHKIYVGEQFAGLPPIEISEARKAAADAETAEIKRDRLKGASLDYQAVEQAWTAQATVIAQRLASVANKVESRFVAGMTPARVRALVEEELLEVTQDLARPIDYPTPGGDAGAPVEDVEDAVDEAVSPASNAKRKRKRRSTAK